MGFPLNIVLQIKEIYTNQQATVRSENGKGRRVLSNHLSPLYGEHIVRCVVQEKTEEALSVGEGS